MATPLATDQTPAKCLHVVQADRSTLAPGATNPDYIAEGGA
ncbi:hypothetical protein [Sphaerisporangium aureirubrum]|uniref:Uncharacterized protein n=1 Tax=Sphaerisporangium aureirubrum TaxID=1544736 RepID=A0ABW1NBQ0_9ACTN